MLGNAKKLKINMEIVMKLTFPYNKGFYRLKFYNTKNIKYWFWIMYIYIYHFYHWRQKMYKISSINYDN